MHGSIEERRPQRNSHRPPISEPHRNKVGRPEEQHAHEKETRRGAEGFKWLGCSRMGVRFWQVEDKRCRCERWTFAFEP